MRAVVGVLALVLCIGCGATAESDDAELTCGAMPDLANCEYSELFSPECPTYLCDGWPENPYGTPEQYVQVVSVCDEALRHVRHIASGMVVCVDE